MREIKFRIWDLDNKKWCNNLDFGLLHNGVLEKLVSPKGCSGYLGNYIINQFTGLKDKNEKEIYEGDIVKFYPYENEVEYYIQGIIEYLECQYILNNRIFKFKNPPAMDIQGLNYYHIAYGLNREVIGNVFENQELINEPKR